MIMLHPQQSTVIKRSLPLEVVRILETIDEQKLSELLGVKERTTNMKKGMKKKVYSEETERVYQEILQKVESENTPMEQVDREFMEAFDELNSPQ